MVGDSFIVATPAFPEGQDLKRSLIAARCDPAIPGEADGVYEIKLGIGGAEPKDIALQKARAYAYAYKRPAIALATSVIIRGQTFTRASLHDFVFGRGHTDLMSDEEKFVKLRAAAIDYVEKRGMRPRAHDGTAKRTCTLNAHVEYHVALFRPDGRNRAEMCRRQVTLVPEIVGEVDRFMPFHSMMIGHASNKLRAEATPDELAADMAAVTRSVAQALHLS